MVGLYISHAHNIATVAKFNIIIQATLDYNPGFIKFIGAIPRSNNCRGLQFTIQVPELTYITFICYTLQQCLGD